MKELVDMFGFLGDMAQQYPIFELINTVVWLDPFWDGSTVDDFDEDHVGRAIWIARSNFVDIYADVMGIMHSSLVFDEDVAGNYIIEQISLKGIRVDDIEQMSWGIPMDTVGINLRDAEIYHSHPEIIPLVTLFGLHVDLDASDPTEEYDPELDEGYYGDEDFEHNGIEIPAFVYAEARVITNSLRAFEYDTHPEWFRVTRFIEWVFGISGNTLIDCTEYDLRDMQPLDWNSHDIELAQAMFEEINPFMIDVLIGRQILDDHPDMLKVLKKNIKRVKKAMATNDKRNNISLRLDWGITGQSVHGEADDNAELLLVRSNAA